MALPISFMRLSNGSQAEMLDLRGTFTDMTDDGARAWPLHQAAILLADDEAGTELELVQVGTVTRSFQRVATGWHRLRYTRKATFSPLPLPELLAALEPRVRSDVELYARTGGALPREAGTAVVTTLAELRPTAGEELRRLADESHRTTRLRGDALQSAAQEADAVRLALAVADFGKAALRDVQPDGATSFLGKLEAVRAAEDTTIAYDGMRFLDFDRLDSPSGAVQFARGYERLTVVNVNKQPLERTTGADLIYINETVPSYVLVQYKAMRREPAPRGSSRLVYRPDGQLGRELDRMRAIAIGDDDKTPASFRLNDGLCFLKLCSPITRLGGSQDLVPGMYLPLSYYDALAASRQTLGPRGGRVFSYETVRRHIHNSLFVNLVRGGWVGSRGATTRALESIVLAGLDAGRSVTVAASSRSRTIDASDR